MTSRALAVTAAFLLCYATEAAPQSLTLTIERGLVTISAENVTLDDILSRWSDTTGLKVVSKNGSVARTPINLRLTAVPEREALQTVLRDLSGYIMGERRDPATGVVTIDRLLILTESTAPIGSTVAQPAVRAPLRRLTPEVERTDEQASVSPLPSREADEPPPASAPIGPPVIFGDGTGPPITPINPSTAAPARPPFPIRAPGSRTEMPKPVPPVDLSAPPQTSAPSAPINNPFGTSGSTARPGQVVPSAPASGSPGTKP
jgi:hypothetical protein